MYFTRTGSCPKCGAPIWSDTSKENGLNPPSNHFSCDCCNPKLISNKKESENISDIIKSLMIKVEELANKVNELNQQLKDKEKSSKPTFLKD